VIVIVIVIDCDCDCDWPIAINIIKLRIEVYCTVAPVLELMTVALHSTRSNLF